MTLAEYALTAGYHFEVQKIVVPDGYILTAQRIKGKLEEDEFTIEDKPVVILQHGLLDNSATWLLDTNNTCILPFMFADLGYDVWLTNTRGNRESFEHMNPIEYNANDHKSKYWNFSWDEMAM